MFSIMLVFMLFLTLFTTGNAAVINADGNCDTAPHTSTNGPVDLVNNINQASDDDVLKALELLQVRAKQIAEKTKVAAEVVE